MARFPSPIKGVPRSRVGKVVQTLLTNPDVGDVDCVEQLDHDYTIRPRRRIPAPEPAPPRRSRKKSTRRKTAIRRG